MIIVLDTETTDLDVAVAKLLEVAIAVIEDDGSVVAEHQILLNPGVHIPEGITEITGISDETVAQAPALSSVWGKFTKLLESATTIIGYNPNYDIDVIRNNLASINVPINITARIVCCKRIWDQHISPLSRNLQNAYKMFVDPEGFTGAHRALSDVRATLAVVQAQRALWGLPGESYAHLDKIAASGIGPSDHLVWNDDRSDIIIMFGKNRGKSVRELDAGYVRWMINGNFPEHVKFVVSESRKPYDQFIASMKESFL